MPFERVCTIAQAPPNSVFEAIVRDEPYAICNVDGKVTALYGVCPHAGGPLGQGLIDQAGHLICPYHMWEFDCATGENVFDPAVVVPTYPVKVEGEDVLADLP
jgi:nitrite reductase/ring-hydroxylating ferredoxin subunit